MTIVEGETTTFSVRLAEPPTEPVVIHVESTNTGTASVTPATITLDAATNEAELTISSFEDDDDVINEVAEVVLSIDGGDTRRVMTRVIDNDVQQLVASATNLAVRESQTGTFNIRLARRPSAPVTVSLWSDAPQIATASPAAVTFDPTFYSVRATITVTGVEDMNTANAMAHIYAGQLQNVTDARVDVDVVDDDMQALVIDATNVPIAEGGTSTFAVRLAFDPLQVTTVGLQSSDPTAVEVTSNLSFDSTNYNVPQTVTVTGTDDVDTLNESVTVTLWGAASGTVSVPVTDNDLLEVLAGSVIEGRSATFYVSLADALPAPLPVSVDVISGDVTVSPSSFFVSDTLIARDFTVTAGVDSSSNADRPALIRVSAPGQTPRDVPITIVDRIPGTLSSIYFMHEDARVGALGYMDVSFHPQNYWPGDGRLVITYPPGYDVSAATFQSSTADGSYSVTATTSTVTVVRTGGTTSYSTHTLRLAGIRNPSMSGQFPISLATQTYAGDLIDHATRTDSVYAASMLAAQAALANPQPGATTTLTFDFTTRNPWPADGKLVIYVPSLLDVANATVTGQSGLDGTLAASVSGSYVTLTRSGGTTVAGGTPISLTLAPVANPPASLATDEFQLTTQTSTGASIDVGFPRGVVIGCPTSITKLPHRGFNVPFGGKPWQYPDGVTGLSWGTDVAYIYSVAESDYLVASDFRFALPQDATITGIAFEIGRDSSGHDAVDRAVRAIKTVIGEADRSSTAAWTGTPGSYGGTTDLWGETWSPADIENSSFGVAIAVKALTPGATSYYVRVGYVTATVYLSCP